MSNKTKQTHLYTYVNNQKKTKHLVKHKIKIRLIYMQINIYEF